MAHRRHTRTWIAPPNKNEIIPAVNAVKRNQAAEFFIAAPVLREYLI